MLIAQRSIRFDLVPSLGATISPVLARSDVRVVVSGVA